MLKAPEQLSFFLDLSGYALSAAISHGLDVMLPLFAAFLPGLWQLSVDVLSAAGKLLTSNTACAACSAAAGHGAASGTSQQQHHQQQSTSHIGPGVGCVLLSLLDALPSMWQCYQALIAQRCEQRQLYLDSCDDDGGDSLSQPSLSQSLGTPTWAAGSGGGAATAVAAELFRQSTWLVQLLTLGRQLHAAAAAGGRAGACPCLQQAAADRRLQLSWRACLDDTVRATRSPLPKVGCS